MTRPLACGSSRTRILLRWLGLLCLACTTAAAERLPIRIYTRADGLANDRVIRIVRDSRGFLWFCTAEGLSRFDGYHFVNYGTEQGLPDQTVNDLIETRDGAYWVATDGGVCRFNPTAGSAPAPESRFTAYRLGGEAEEEVHRLYEDRAGRLWAGTMGGLFCLDRGGGQSAQFRRVELKPPAQPDGPVQVWAFAEDREGSLWIGHSLGLARRLPGGRMIHFAIRPAQRADYVWNLMTDREDRLWIGHESGLVVLQPQPAVAAPGRFPWLRMEESRTVENVPGGSARLPARPGDAARFAFAAGSPLFQSVGSRVWAGTRGLSEFDGGRFRRYTTAEGLVNSAVISLAEDRDGNLWMGTHSGGAMRLARHALLTFTGADGLGSENVLAVFESRDGALCVINHQWRVNRYDGRRFVVTRLNLPGGVVDTERRFLRTVMQDRAGEWWAPTDEGLFRFPNVSRVEQLAGVRPKAVYTTRHGLASDHLQRLFEDARGDLWISSSTPAREVLTRWERATQSFHRYGAAEGLPPFKTPVSFGEDGGGNLWVGFLEGDLARARGGHFELLDEVSRLSPGSINGLYLDRARRLWVATGRGGLLRLDDPRAARPRFVAYTTANGMASNGVRCLTEDESGGIHLGTAQGVDRLDPATGLARHYSSADGLAGNEVNVAFRDRQGALWFGTKQGLSRLAPEPDQPRPPPPVLIGGLRVAGVAYALSDLGEVDFAPRALEAGENQIEIDFFGLSFSPGEVLRYQYRLEGADPDWKPPTDLRTVNYANLSPGDYRFRVRALGADGAQSPAPAAVNFRILPPVWRRWWFVALAALLLASAGAALARRRAARVEALRESEDRFRTLAETASDAIVTIDESSTIIFVNPAAEHVFGYTKAEMVGAKLTMLMPEYLRHLHEAGFGRYVRTGERHMSWEAIELPGRHRGGREIPLEISFGELTSRGRRLFTGIVRDVTERKRAEEALLKAQEERLAELERVRRRIATDLHDDIGSSLTQISIMSEVLRQGIAREDAPEVRPLELIAGASRELVDTMSDIVWAINPQKDHLSDLTRRMLSFASELFTARNIAFDFRAPGAEHDMRLGAGVRREVFLIFKESVNNLVRHSGCTRADVEFRIVDDALTLVTRDDGSGFDPGLSRDGHGLESMRERARDLGGSLDVDSESGRGTTVTLRAPLTTER